MLVILMLGLPRTILVVGNIVSEGWDPGVYTEVDRRTLYKLKKYMIHCNPSNMPFLGPRLKKNVRVKKLWCSVSRAPFSKMLYPTWGSVL